MNIQVTVYVRDEKDYAAGTKERRELSVTIPDDGGDLLSENVSVMAALIVNAAIKAYRNPQPEVEKE